MARRGKLLEGEPSDVVMFLGSEVRRRSVPGAHQPSAEPCWFISRSCGHATQMRRGARHDLHAELLVQLPRQRVQLGLSGLDKPAWQVPHTRVRPLVGPAMREQETAVTDQRTDNDRMHSLMRSRT